MAYNNNFPVTYQQPMVYPVQPQYAQTYQPQAPQMVPQQPREDNGIVWVQGEAGAKSYLVGSGKSVMLMDSESSTFYIKSTDMSGMPQPLRIFDYTERTAPNNRSAAAVSSGIDMSQFVTWDAFEEKLASALEDRLSSLLHPQKSKKRETEVNVNE